MDSRYQRGYVGCVKRRCGSACWEFLWREDDVTGKRVRRTTVIGSVEQFPTEEAARAAVSGLRADINLSDGTKSKIRSLMSVLFNHAIRYEWLEQGSNPITLVRQSAKRKRTPEIVEPQEIQSLLQQLTSCFRLMVLLNATTGRGRSELFALKWSDVDFANLEINIARSIYMGKIGNCKTETSRKPVPLDIRVAADLWLWKEEYGYRDTNDWVFASPHTSGQSPFWPVVLQKVIRPAATRAGITKIIGWHTFRHAYSTLLIANGENVKVVSLEVMERRSHLNQPLQEHNVWR